MVAGRLAGDEEDEEGSRIPKFRIGHMGWKMKASKERREEERLREV